MDIGPILAAARLSPTLLTSDDGRVDGDAFQHFIHLLCHESDNPILGLETGDFVQPGSYSVLGYITMSCATLGEAVACITPFEKLVGDMGITHITTDDDQIGLVWRCAYTDPTVRPQLVDNVFASWINYARWLADNQTACPVRVNLERRSPGAEQEQAYTERWRCPVHFEAGENAVFMDRRLLSMPLRQPDSTLRKTLETHAQNQLTTLDTDTALTTRVKHGIQQQLLHGITRQDVIAEQIGMTSRTLQRKLSQEGVSYQKLLDEVRQAMAEDYLTNSQLPIPDIALRLGFSETTSFHRKFKSNTGRTPGEFRQELVG
ncbi:AraC family transcriptional regulator [Marinobacter caseinilyticus]|uniref:AraC family transcriptional regulator n=1 Tax=Marinobacter caseinilyticus TaxID=2692195 RepID=UPI001F1684C4|nr:AraC family transcriptional regulator [Marinobacter caseinilyticus]